MMLSVAPANGPVSFQAVCGGNIAAKAHPYTDSGFGNLSASGHQFTTADPFTSAQMVSPSSHF
jgi:hypothetical protein